MIIINTFYVDESGSMTKKGLNSIRCRYFIICIVLTKDNKKLKHIYDRFVTSNMKQLKKEDWYHNMFYKNGKFKELKGTQMSVEMKKKFIRYFCRNDILSVFYICVSNENVADYFYGNTARAFNYLIRLSIEHNTSNGLISNDMNFLYIDERNVRTDTISTLEEYLNIELVVDKHIQKSFHVRYCQSEVKNLIQIADVFSNIYYSFIVKGNIFDEEINLMRKNNYIKNEFYFPFI